MQILPIRRYQRDAAIIAKLANESPEMSSSHKPVVIIKLAVLNKNFIALLFTN